MPGEPCWGNLGGTLGEGFLKDFLRDAGGTWMPGMPGADFLYGVWGHVGISYRAFAGHRDDHMHTTIKILGKNPYKLRLVRE